MAFPEKFVAFRKKLEQEQDAAFISHENVTIAGRTAALKSSFEAISTRRLLGLIPMGEGHAHEHRLLFAVPEFDVKALDDWWNYAVQAMDELVQPDEAHEFSIVSLILATEKVESDAVKKLRRLSYEKTFSGEQSGWVSVRAAAADLGKREVYTNRIGAPLKDILKKLI